MSPLSGWVLGAATVVASPALWSTFVEGSMPMDVALMRFLVAVPVSWLLISLVAEMAFPAPLAKAPEVAPPPDPGAGEQAQLP